jgi:hypothetical protein
MASDPSASPPPTILGLELPTKLDFIGARRRLVWSENRCTSLALLPSTQNRRRGPHGPQPWTNSVERIASNREARAQTV